MRSNCTIHQSVLNSLIKILRSTQEYCDTISYANVGLIDLDVQFQFEKSSSIR